MTTSEQQDFMDVDPNSVELNSVLMETKASSPKPIETGSNAVATKEEVNLVIAEIAKAKNIKITHATYSRILCTIAHIVQDGATSPKQADSKKVTEYGIELKVGELRAYCKKTGLTVRKLARGIRKPVIEVAQAFQLEGNLAKSYKLQNPQYEEQDLIWVSDFQTFSKDPSMPEHVRKWLLENYKQRFKPNESDAAQ